MGFAAWMVFLCSVVAAFLCLALLLHSGLVLYRSLLSARKDYLAWAETFASFGESLSKALRGLQEKVGAISAAGERMGEEIDEIRDFWEELRSNPILRAARFVNRMRR